MCKRYMLGKRDRGCITNFYMCGSDLEIPPLLSASGKIFFLQEGNEETKIKHTYNCLDDSECLVACMCLNS